ncbi:hypothetical protein BCR36DRAFT_121069 [Piromyces finnis]|uniref:Uncharacterized protein n=1 Tax=Piromyces finnis TaxID=1754191 RepID=A0A1Y1V2S2_9FUNG|nr:hypothetical protein BCR36DRAFT_121069 [Piromyces finnis]|eukprot:ORX45051.1 hypothetical protein BCR36DRAFT_121069 [Piromyces finnis]
MKYINIIVLFVALFLISTGFSYPFISQKNEGNNQKTLITFNIKKEETKENINFCQKHEIVKRNKKSHSHNKTLKNDLSYGKFDHENRVFKFNKNIF